MRISKGQMKRAVKKPGTYSPAADKETRRAFDRIAEGRWPGSIGNGIREIAISKGYKV